jgi:hypothetical protein
VSGHSAFEAIGKRLAVELLRDGAKLAVDLKVDARPGRPRNDQANVRRIAVIRGWLKLGGASRLLLKLQAATGR